jgi:serine/threonine protein kinase
MGEVYKGRDTRLARTVAIKVLPALLHVDPVARERFEREARAISALNHPNICTLHDVGQQDGVDFLVMEYVEGETLAARLAKGPLPLMQWIAIGRCIRRFHDAGVHHADLNAHNILLAPEQVYLIDFDRGTLRKRGWWADTTLVRLYRSLEKVTLLAAPESFTDQDWHSLLAGYRESAGLPQASLA